MDGNTQGLSKSVADATYLSISDAAGNYAEKDSVIGLNFAPQVLSKASFPTQLAFTLSFRHVTPLTPSHYASLTLRGVHTPRARIGDNPSGVRLTFAAANTGDIKTNASTNSFERAFLNFYAGSSGGSPVLTRQFQVWIGA